ncbi:MAG: hypothetical protein P8X90_29010 [Desulfobacterales bacterium]
MSFELTAWLTPEAERPGCAEYELRAVGAGDAAFAAYTPNVQDVFVFHDPLEDVPQDKLTYVVAGWYADPKQDPLRGVTAHQPEGWSDPAQWAQLMQYFGWSVGSDDPHSEEVKLAVAAGQKWLRDHGIAVDSENPQSRYPAQMLCHGMVCDVNWTGTTGEPQLGVPTPNAAEVDIAVGNTAIDALSALVQKHLGDQYPQAGEILQAFQYKLLNEMDKQGFEARLLEGIREQWFGESHTGRLWQILEPERPDLAAGPLSEPPPITDALKGQLAKLNTIQTQINTLTVLLRELQGELYRAWWKKQAYEKQFPPPDGTTEAEVAKAYQTALSAVESTTDTLNSLRRDRDSILQDIGAKIGGQIEKDPDTGEVLCRTADETKQLRLVSSAPPRFWHCNDPVILVGGVPRAYKHGEDGRFEDSRTLFCRFSGQTLNSITVNAVIGKSAKDCPDNRNCYTVTEKDLQLTAEIDIGKKIPLEILDILLESYLLDITNSTTLAAEVLRKLDKTEPDAGTLAKQVAKEQTLVWNPALNPALDKRTLAHQSGLNGGAVPSKVAVEIWSPPWSPLYLDWEVRWAPSCTDPKEILVDRNDRTWWEFNPGIQDFEWQGPAPPDFSNARTFKGRTLITPKDTGVLTAALEKFLDDYRDADLNLQAEFLAQAGNLGGTADGPQAIGILNAILEVIKNWNILSQSISGFNQLLLMRDITQHPPPAEDIAELIGAQGDTMPSTITNPDFFNPIRGGHMQISNLWVVDDFGQVFNAVGQKGVIAQVSPVRAMGVVTAESSTLVQLPPRIIQGARIQFRLIAADGDLACEAVSDPNANPVCGWVLPNHLDRGLMVYDAAGQLNGEILVTGEGIDRRARWQAAPDKTAAVGAEPAIPNRHMADVVSGLLSRPDSADAFADLLTVIDATLWTVDPMGERDNQNLSVLIGRPLALVRAKLYFELAGPPACDQSWQQTNQRRHCEFFQAQFPVNLGNFQLRDDGLLGYFTESNFSEFRSVFLPRELKARQPPYVIQEDIRLPFNYPNQPNGPGAYVTAVVYLLVDPRGGIHAQTGLFPNKKIVVPAVYVDHALQAMDVTFRTGPLLTAPDTIRMPIPAEIDGTWSWIEHSGIEILESKIEKAKKPPIRPVLRIHPRASEKAG